MAEPKSMLDRWIFLLEQLEASVDASTRLGGSDLFALGRPDSTTPTPPRRAASAGTRSG
jgi:hypothetical protein